MENGQSFFFSLASHALRAGEARALRARKTLYRFFLLILRKKTDCFAVYHCVVGISKRKLKQKVAEIKVRGIECVLNCIILVCTM